MRSRGCRGPPSRRRSAGTTSRGSTRCATPGAGAGGDLTLEPLRADGEHLDFNVTRCRFAELYERLGARDLGFLLSCGRDFTLSEGYSPRLHLERTQTIMQGAPCCDFRYTFAADGDVRRTELQEELQERGTR